MNHSSSSRVSNSRRLASRPLLLAAAGVAVSAIPQLSHGQTLSPIAVTGFTQNVIATTSPASASTTAGFDAYNNIVFYTVGYPGSDGTSGIPDNGTIVSQANPNTTFQLAPLQAGTNNVLLFNDAGNQPYAPQASSGTIDLSTPAYYSNLAFLNAGANAGGGETINYTLNFVGGGSTSGSFGGQDWFNGQNAAISALGRVSRTDETIDSPEDNGGNPDLYENDISIPAPYNTEELSSINFSYTSPGGTTWGLFAVSGAATLFPEVYVGIDPNNAANNGKADTTSLTFVLQGAPSAVISGQPIIFDDSATGPTNVVVGAAGITPGSTTFNNSSKNYSFTGGGIGGSGGLTLNGTGSVTLANVNTYTGDTVINAGTLVIASGGSIASPTVAVLNGTFNIASGGQTGGTPLNIVDTATVNLFNSTQVLGSLTGNGVVNVNGTALTVGAGTSFSGNIGGTGGSLNIAGGTITAQSASNLSGITGPITIGTGSNTASLILSDNSGTAFSGNTLTIGSNGTLGSTGGSAVTCAGPIVLAATATAPATIAEDGATFTLPSPISGVGSLSLSGTNGGSFALNASNSYQGNTLLSGDPVGLAPYNTVTVTLGNDHGISPNGGVIISDVGGALNLDLHGHNPTVQFLTGPSNGNYSVTNSGASTATLTITNVNTSTGAATFSTAITGNIAVVKAGTTGNQTLDGANTYTGGTKITGGTLTAGSSSALGTGLVTLSGGTLNLAAPAGSLSGFSGFSLNGNGGNSGTDAPSISSDNSTLTLTTGDSQGGEAASSFFSKPILLSPTGFTASFTYNPNQGGADGTTFTLQNDPNGKKALGGAGGELGYTGIQNSVALQFDIYNGGYLGLAANGSSLANNGTYDGNTNPPALLEAGDSWNVTLDYNASTGTITETVTDPNDFYVQFGYGNSVTYQYQVNVASYLNSNSAYIGFTGGDGGATSLQQISNFTFTDGSLAGAVALANQVTTAPGTTSTLSAAVVTGQNVGSVGGLNIASGSTLHILSVPSTTGTRLVLTTPTLTLDGTPGASTGTLDLENNDLVITGGSLSDTTKEVAQGYNLVHGANWQGMGITSSTAASDTTHLTALGVIQNDQNNPAGIYSAANPFDGYAANPGDILVKYTYFGDANLDGKVDGSDYSLIDNGYASKGALTGWLNGDFNYDGVIDGSDYALIDNAYNNQAAPLDSAAEVAASTALVAGPTAVPEPASLGVLAVGAAALVTRRRRA